MSDVRPPLVGPRAWNAYEEAERAYEDSISTRYNRDYHEPPLMQWHSESFVVFVARFFHPGDRVLDLGCGPASLWPLWTKHLQGAASLTGVDLSPGMVDEARRQFPGDDFRVGSFFDIPAEAGAYDIVLVSSALHHIPDESVPDALKEIHRVLDEHGVLVGREPLGVGRLIDQGGWMPAALMQLRHLAYRLTHTREYPEADPGPAHHAYDVTKLVSLIGATLPVTTLEFRHPVSPILSRARNEVVVRIARALDELVAHRGGQEAYYVARKNFSTAEDVKHAVRMALEENKLSLDREFLALVEAAASHLEQHLAAESGDERVVKPGDVSS